MFNREQFLSDLRALDSLTEAIKHGPEHHIKHYLKEAQPYQARVDQVFAALDNIEKYQAALLRLAYDPNISEFSSDPNKSLFHVPYFALGGRMEAGKLLDTEDTLKARLLIE